MSIKYKIKKTAVQIQDGLRFHGEMIWHRLSLVPRQRGAAWQLRFLAGLMLMNMLTGCSARSESLMIRDYPSSSGPAALFSKEERLKQRAVDTLNRYFGLELTVEGWQWDIHYSSAIRTETQEYVMIEEMETMLVLFLRQRNADEISYGVCLDEKTQEVLAAQMNFETAQPLKISPETEQQIQSRAKAWFEINRPEFDMASLTGIYAVQMKNQIALSIFADAQGHKGYLYTNLADGRPMAFGTGSFAENLLVSIENADFQAPNE